MPTPRPQPDRAPDAELQERLLDQLLHEELGSDVPPDLTDRIMMQVRGRQAMARSSRRIGGGFSAGWRAWWLPASLAAVITIAVGLWIRSYTTGGGDYPATVAQGKYTVVGGGEIKPGATLVTAPQQEAQITLGGYATVQIAPDSRLKIMGDGAFKEAVFLEAGEAVSQVERKRGAFAVVTEHLKASVTGTKFSVKVGQELDAKTGEQVRRTTVKVIEGTVDVILPSGTVPLKAGGTMTYPDPAAPPPPGTTTGGSTPPTSQTSFEPVSQIGEVHLIGIISETRQGFVLTERSGRQTVVQTRAERESSGIRFLTGEYVVILRDGKLARAMRVGAAPE
ncbi:MAG: FecR domain-containing protein [Phycisphaerae bacterium]|nr:FecR domain-containing protein [Tepidisphaeraceae bacterium]